MREQPVRLNGRKNYISLENTIGKTFGCLSLQFLDYQCTKLMASTALPASQMLEQESILLKPLKEPDANPTIDVEGPEINMSDWDGSSSRSESDAEHIEDDSSRVPEPDNSTKVLPQRASPARPRISTDHAIDLRSLKGYSYEEFVAWYGDRRVYDESQRISRLVDLLIDELILADEAPNNIKEGVDCFVNYLVHKLRLPNYVGFVPKLHKSMFTPMYMRSAYLKDKGWPEAMILTRSQGEEVMARWRELFVNEECNPKRNAFWAYVDRVCGSQVLAKVVINVGGGTTPHLSSAIAGLMNVKVSRQHAALITLNSSCYSDVAAMAKKRVNYLKYKLKYVEKLRNSKSRGQNWGDLDTELLRELDSGCLHTCLKEAKEIHSKFKRNFTDIFATVSGTSETPLVRRERPSLVVLRERPSKRNKSFYD